MLGDYLGAVFRLHFGGKKVLSGNTFTIGPFSPEAETAAFVNFGNARKSLPVYLRAEFSSIRSLCEALHPYRRRPKVRLSPSVAGAFSSTYGYLPVELFFELSQPGGESIWNINEPYL